MKNLEKKSRDILVYDLIPEMKYQDDKWGIEQDARLGSDLIWALVLGEENGEVQKQVLENKFSKEEILKLRKEIVQCASVAIQWIAAIDDRY